MHRLDLGAAAPNRLEVPEHDELTHAHHRLVELGHEDVAPGGGLDLHQRSLIGRHPVGILDACLVGILGGTLSALDERAPDQQLDETRDIGRSRPPDGWGRLRFGHGSDCRTAATLTD